MPLRIPPPIQMLLAAVLMWVLDHWMPFGQWMSAPWNRLGGLVAVGGIAIAVAAFMRFRKTGTTVNPHDPSKASRLVTDGVFRVSRNPMYLGLLLLLIGWAVWLGGSARGSFHRCGGCHHLGAERALSRNFGEEYVSWRRRCSAVDWVAWVTRH